MWLVVIKMFDVLEKWFEFLELLEMGFVLVNGIVVIVFEIFGSDFVWVVRFGCVMSIYVMKFEYLFFYLIEYFDWVSFGLVCVLVVVGVFYF